MLKIIKADGAAEKKQIEDMRARAAQTGEGISAVAAAVLQDVRENGYAAVEKYSLQFDGAKPREITAEELDAAYESCPKELIAAMEQAAADIRDYNEKLLVRSAEWRNPAGGIVGRVVRGLTRVGIYVPGGTAAYPSSVLMNAVPAKVAGVEEIIMVTPPTKNLNQAVLAAAKIAGVDRVIGVGGTQAIAALTYGAGFIPKVDKICGPGNAYVAAAKRLAYGAIDIDMVAGPSEVLVIADETSNPKYVAADLLSQAEHDVLASAVLLTTSEELARAVDGEIVRQTGYLSRKDVIAQSLRDFGAAIVCPDLQTCADLANEIAPEHLELMVQDARSWLPLVRNAGSVFLGYYTCESIGDYFGGCNHVLPTNGTARFASALSCDSFIKKSSYLHYSKEALQRDGGKIMNIAHHESLDGHANAVKVRMKP